MIARRWHGRVPSTRKEAYRDFLLEFKPTVTRWDVAGQSVPGLLP